MRTLIWLLAALLVAGCTKPNPDDPSNEPLVTIDPRVPGGIVDAPFGMDTRPENPTCLAPDRPPNQANVQLDAAFGGETFNQPILALQHPVNPDRWYVLLKAGFIVTFLESDPSGTRTTALNITGTLSGTTGNSDERGLLGMAFHPDFASNNYVYISYVNNTQQDNVIERREISANGTFDAGVTPVEIFRLSQPFSNHNGGGIAFSPIDGYLYIGIGDGGFANDPEENGQDINELHGKMLRIDVDGGSPYAIPPDNPFVGATGRDEIFAYGFRNPWRFSFDQVTGELWVGDVGQGAVEEISLVQRGGNYGWDNKEGSRCFELNPCDGGGMIDPVVEHPQSPQEAPTDMLAESITGGYVYRGTKIPELVGTYIYGDYVTQNVWALYHDTDGNPSPQRLFVSPGSISSFAQSVDGEIYLLSYNQDIIYEINPTGGPQPNNFPKKLSETGCMDAADTTSFYSGVIPYGIVAPFWSDGATKERGLAIPDGTTIDIDAEGDWDLPVGSVLLKNFYLEGVIFETRLLVRHSDGDWGGYTYEWNEDGTDADLLPAGKQKPVGGSNTEWFYPGRSQCLKCHTTVAGRSLGIETQQMNRRYVYPTGRNSNQVATLDHIGMFTTSPGDPAGLNTLPPVYGSGPIEARARTYLHTNCSMCHRAGGTGLGPQDFLFSTATADLDVCDVDPLQGDLGINGAKLLDPGSPASSILSLRMHAVDANKMPTVGLRADPQGTSLVDEWIASMTSCPQ